MSEVLGLETLQSVIDDAHKRMRRRRTLWSAAALATIAVGIALFLSAGPTNSGSTYRHSPQSSVPRGPEAIVTHWRLAAMFRRPYGFGGISKPPGGAALAHERVLLTEPTPAGVATIWTAPDWARPGSCAWLTIGARVYGGSCRRASSPRRGLSETVPLALRIHGKTVGLIWGQVGADVAGVRIRLQPGQSLGLHRGPAVRLHLSGHAFLYVFPRAARHETAWLVARLRRPPGHGKAPSGSR